MSIPVSIAGLFSHLPRRERPLECIEFLDGRTLCAARVGLYVVTELGERVLFPWWQVQRLVWVADLRALSVMWSDPSLQALRGQISGAAPEEFMRLCDSFIRSTMVMHRSVLADNGVRVTVQIRRDEEGMLLSVSTADGILDEQGSALLQTLEWSLRESVGLEA